MINGENLIENLLLTKFCNDIIKNPTQVAQKLNNLNTFAQKGVGKNFPLTAAYITKQAGELFGTVASCETFFNGLQTPFQADLQKNGQKITNLPGQLMPFLLNILQG